MTRKRKPRRLASHVQPAPRADDATLHPPITPPSPAEALTLITRLEEIRQSRVLTLVTSPDIAVRGDVVEHAYEQLYEMGHVPKTDLFLHSVGGQTEIPWRLITLIRCFCKQFAVLIPGVAHSAATHLAMGADEIVMGPLSELSPVDPARSYPLLPRANENDAPIPVSVQDLRHCVEFVKEEVGTDSPDALASVFTALFQKVHPLAIGAIQQSYALSRLISEKALSTHMDPDANKDQIDLIVDAFSDQFFSHDYRIGWQEAKEVGLPVTLADQALWEIMWLLYKHYRSYFLLARDAAGPRNEQALLRPILWMDSVSGRRILEEVIIEGKPTGTRWTAVKWEDAEEQEDASTGEDQE